MPASPWFWPSTQSKQPVGASLDVLSNGPVMVSMADNVSKFSGISSLVIFVNFMHRRFIMAHIVQEAFILMMVHSFFVKSWQFLGLWQFVSLYSKRWDSFKMAVDDCRWICLCLVETAIGGPRWATRNHSSLEDDANLWLATLKVVKLSWLG